MKCAGFRKYLIPYVEGTLSERLQKPIEEHLSACDACTCELEEIRQTVDVLKQTEYPAMEPAFDLRSRVMARIAGEPVRKPWLANRLQAYSAAAAALLIFAVVILTVEPNVFRIKRPAQIPQPTAQKRVTPPSIAKKGTTSQAPLGNPSMPANTGVADSQAKYRQAEPASPSSAVAVGRTQQHVAPREEDNSTALRSGSGYEELNRVDETSPSAPATPTAVAEQKSSGIEYRTPAPGSEGFTKEPSAIKEHREIAVQSAYGGASQQEVRQDGAPAGRILGAESAKSDSFALRDGKPAKAKFAMTADEDVLLLEKKLREFPNSPTVLTDLLRTYRGADRARDEYAIAQRLTKLNPDNAGYWFARAQAAERAKMPRTAVACYRRAIKLNLTGADLETAKSRLKALE